LATVRQDGSPRVSGTEVDFGEGELRLGSMPGARKARDLQRDPRFALHANPSDETMVDGDAKVAGRVREVTGAEFDRIMAGYPAELRESHLFVLDLDEAVLTTVSGNLLHIDLWRPGQGVRRSSRK
ncbi:MAG: pyridoxamine 5'-phosphate oxidase family protein, partial [Aldersonia sp.]|nr:pyridoxamine 5'-phosphate oxidase family protein [Aldersonia sp.]